VKRAVRICVAVLNHAARTLRDGNKPWLSTAVPRIEAPDWRDARQPYPLTQEEQDRLIAALPDHLKGPVLFGVLTGARQDEVCELRWSWMGDVNGAPEGAFWWLPGEHTKNGDGRWLVCKHAARALIDTQAGKDSEYVFPSPRGGRLYRINNTAWKRARAKTGIPARVHDLRHTFGRRLEAAGVPWDYRKVLLGHRIADVTAYYSGPGLLRLLQAAGQVQGKTDIPRPVLQKPTQEKAPSRLGQLSA
jgi:integrase